MIRLQLGLHMRRSPVLDEGAGGMQPSSFAVERGNAVHRLMQYLPDIAAAERHMRADAYLCRTVPSWTETQRRDVLASVFAVLEQAEFAPLFNAGSKAEIAVMGIVDIHGHRRAVSGQIDRLAVFDDHVLLADFKTGRPPQSAEDIPSAYFLQLALYIKLLEPLYPGMEIRPLLVYMQGPTVFKPDSRKLSALIEELAKAMTQA